LMPGKFTMTKDTSTAEVQKSMMKDSAESLQRESDDEFRTRHGIVKHPITKTCVSG